MSNLNREKRCWIRKGAREVCTLVENRRASRCAGGLLFLVAIGCLLCAHVAAAVVDLSRAEALRIGKKIWQNECAGTVAGLTSWNAGENFASLGIGHFIWYPKGGRGPFDESFPEFISFAIDRKADVPEVARANVSSGCPWSSRAEFMAAAQTPPMQQLRKFLAGTVDLQTDFLVRRLRRALPKMLAAAPASDRDKVQRQFDRLAQTPQGCYALVDYVNFKGEGVLATERYRGEGWGLLQVLAGMSEDQPPTEAFAQSARRVLTLRVHNAPPDRGERRWLQGWLARINSYTHA